jgi:hypothetical protein
MTSDDESSVFTPEELLDGIVGRFIQANDEAQRIFVADVRKLLRKVREDRLAQSGKT